MPDGAAGDVEEVFRRESGRALATIAGLVGDVGLAEDAVQEAFVAALRRWPESGVPANPGAWITTTARNRALDVVRRETKRPSREEGAVRHAQTLALEATPPILHPVADEQLRLMFTCCHPAFAPEVRVTLTLRLVSGLRVPEIARALLQGEEAVAKRLQRAKTKIREAAIPLRVPPPELLGERLPSVLECIYLTFTEGYAATEGDELVRPLLCEEAVRLARLVVTLLPDEPGAEALLALLLLQDSRRAARLDADGEVVLLADQDRSRWDHDRIAEGLAWLDRATGAAADGTGRRERRDRGDRVAGAGDRADRFVSAGGAASGSDRRDQHGHLVVSAGAAAYLLQAAIAAEHARATTWEHTDWPAIVSLYDQLASLTGSPVVLVNRAVAVSFADGPDVALPLLDGLADDPRLAGSHLLHAARADVRRRLGQPDQAADLYRQALALATTEPERALLRRRLAELD